jgi:SulP family sulfate permease
MEYITAIFHFTNWLQEYSWEDARSDALAGLTVGVMLIPQSMAYATLAGMPPIYGLYASLVPLLIYPLFGTARKLAIGTVAIDMVLIAAGLGGLAAAGSSEYIALAILLTAMVGVLQIMMGMARLGFVVNLLSRPVIAGFITAAPVIIAFSQLGNLLGLSLQHTQDVFVLLQAAVDNFHSVHGYTTAVGVGAIVILMGFRRWKPLFPAALFVVVAGILLSWLADLPELGVAVIGEIPTGLPDFSAPAVSWDSIKDLFPTAVTLALVQFMNVMSLGKVFTSRGQHMPNKELLAIGASNLGGSFFQSIPVSGSFSRTAVNAQAGARTPLADVFAAALIGLTLLILTPLFRLLPMPVLAAIVVAACFNLVDVDELVYLFRAKRRDGMIALLTIVTVLTVGIQEGILIGIGASLFAVLYRMSRPNVAELGHVPGTRQFRDVSRFPEAETISGIFIIRMDASFSFANAEYLKDRMLGAAKENDPPVRALVIDASSVNDLDTTAVSTLADVVDTLADEDIALYFTGMTGPVRDTLLRSGLKEKVGEENFFLSPHRAVRHILTNWEEQHLYGGMENDASFNKEKEVFKEADAEENNDD